MAYIKIYDNKLMPIGVVDVDSFSAIEGGERYVKIKDENGVVIGAVNIDGDVSVNDITRFVTTFGDNFLPTGVKDVTLINYYYDSQIGTMDDVEDTPTLPANAEINIDGNIGTIVNGNITWHYDIDEMEISNVPQGQVITFVPAGSTHGAADNVEAEYISGQNPKYKLTISDYYSSQNGAKIYYGNDVWFNLIIDQQ